MTTTERIIAVEAELNLATQQVNVWRERQLMAQGALNVLRVIASEKNEEINTSNSDNAAAAGDDDGASNVVIS